MWAGQATLGWLDVQYEHMISSGFMIFVMDASAFSLFHMYLHWDVGAGVLPTVFLLLSYELSCTEQQPGRSKPCGVLFRYFLGVV